MEGFGRLLFGIAVFHTLVSPVFENFSQKFSKRSLVRRLFHLWGEPELVFGFWAIVFIVALFGTSGFSEASNFLKQLRLREPVFVGMILIVAGSKPLIEVFRGFLFWIAQKTDFQREIAVYFSCLFIGPLLGSLITEPAAMTITALILKKYLQPKNSRRFKYQTLATLFVNVSLGGALTPFAAPPIVMVMDPWKIDTSFIFTQIGWKAALAVFLNACYATWINRSELSKMNVSSDRKSSVPTYVVLGNLMFLVGLVACAESAIGLIFVFLGYLGFYFWSRSFQFDFKIKQGASVAFFLFGLVLLGGLQKSWLEPLLSKLDQGSLFLGVTGLTAIADNALLTYLGSQLTNVTESFKYLLLTAALTGGGLTVIANAPNPVGISILEENFIPNGVQPFWLLIHAILPTLVCAVIFWFFRPA